MAKTYLKFCQLIYLAIFALGIQFANSLQLANMSSIYRFLGAPSHLLPYLGLAAPIAGLIIQPLVGQLSDETFTVYGRRRPYLFGWSILAILCCFLIPWATSVGFAAVLMWILSCSINGTIESLRALTGDIVPNPQKASAFAWQTILSGAGAGFAATLPYFFSKIFILKTPAYTIPLPLKISFIVGGILWFFCMYWTLKHVTEPLARHQELYRIRKTQAAHTRWQKISSLTKKLIHNTFHLPPVMKQFGLIQILTWMGLYAMWLYFSVAISQHLYGLPSSPTLERQPQYAKLLEKGAMTTNFYFSIYQYMSVAYALCLPLSVKYITPRKLHGISLIIGAIGLSLISFTHNNATIFGCMLAIGIMWGSIMTLPYAIVSAELPANKMGIYLGLFNISITLPQIIAGLFLHPVYQYIFHYRAIDIMLMSGLFIFCGGVLTLWQKPTTSSHKNFQENRLSTTSAKQL